MASYILKAVIFIFVLYGVSFGEKCISCHEVHYKEIGGCTSCHRGVADTSRIELAHYKLITGDYAGFFIPDNENRKQGQIIIDEAGCRRCHMIGDKGGYSASTLNSSAQRLSTQELVDAIKTPNESMPYFSFKDTDLTNLINALYFYAFQGVTREITQTVHFTNSKSEQVFENKCGGCHKALSSTGASGKHDLAPNLSGMNSTYAYEINGKKWDKELLEKWLKNPRDVKSNALMPIIVLTDEERVQVISELMD